MGFNQSRLTTLKLAVFLLQEEKAIGTLMIWGDTNNPCSWKLATSLKNVSWGT